MNIEVLSLSEKTRKSNHLQMSLQRQHFLLSYLKTLSAGPAGVRTDDLPHGTQPTEPTSRRYNVAMVTSDQAFDSCNYFSINW